MAQHDVEGEALVGAAGCMAGRSACTRQEGHSGVVDRVADDARDVVGAVRLVRFPLLADGAQELAEGREPVVRVGRLRGAHDHAAEHVLEQGIANADGVDRVDGLLDLLEHRLHRPTERAHVVRREIESELGPLDAAGRCRDSADGRCRDRGAPRHVRRGRRDRLTGRIAVRAERIPRREDIVFRMGGRCPGCGPDGPRGGTVAPRGRP